MKADIHPDSYRLVVFEDLNSGQRFLTKSTAASEETTKHEGQSYPLVKVHISSASHPFYTGQEKHLDIEGRIDKFKARQQAAKNRPRTVKAAKVKTTPTALKLTKLKRSLTKT